jgi:hypothetical protein
VVVAAVLVLLVLVFGVCFHILRGLLGFVDGLRGQMRLVPAWSSGVMILISAIAPIGVQGLLMLLPVVRKDNFVYQLPFISLSFARVTFVCLVFSPQCTNK